MDEKAKQFEAWCVMELMGHVRLGGYVTETTLAGMGVLRIDIPEIEGSPASTQFVPPSTLYRLTPVTEEIARAVAAKNRPQPISYWEMPKALPAGTGGTDDEPRDGDDPYAD